MSFTKLFNTVNAYYRRMISMVNFLVFLEIIIFCFVVAIWDLVHDTETIFHLSYVLTALDNLF